MKEIHRRFEGTILVSGDSKEAVISALLGLLHDFRERTPYSQDGSSIEPPTIPINNAIHAGEFSYSFIFDYDPHQTHEQYVKDLGSVIPE